MCPNGLSGAVEVSFGCRIGRMRGLEGGEEVFLVDTEVGERVLRLGPGWRSSAELDWSYALASYAAAKMDEVGATLSFAGRKARYPIREQASIALAIFQGPRSGSRKRNRARLGCFDPRPAPQGALKLVG